MAECHNPAECRTIIEHPSTGSAFALKNTHYVVFSGGASKGISLWAAFVTLRERILAETGRDIVRSLRGTAGTSIGSVLAFALCVTDDTDKITELVTNTQLWNGSFIDRFVSTQWLLHDQGFASHDALLAIVDVVMAQLGVRKDITFSELRLLYQREFVCNASCLTRQAVTVFSSQTSPERRVREAIAMSMCIPGVFTPFVEGCDVYVDGGVYDNVLLSVFPLDRAVVIATAPSCLTLQQLQQQDVTTFFASSAGSATSLHQAEKINRLPPELRKRVLLVADGSVQASVTVTSAQIQQLWHAGVNSARTFFGHCSLSYA